MEELQDREALMELIMNVATLEDLYDLSKINRTLSLMANDKRVIRHFARKEGIVLPQGYMTTVEGLLRMKTQRHYRPEISNSVRRRLFPQ